MANGFVHVELSTDDVAKAKKFYKSIFDWKLEDAKMGPGMVYTMISTGGVGGGMTKKMMPRQPTAWLAYVGVDDLDKTVAKAKKGGATIVVERQEVADMGALAVIIDPTGAALGLWEPKMAPKKGAAKKGAKKAAAPKKKAAKKTAKKK